MSNVAAETDLATHHPCLPSRTAPHESVFVPEESTGTNAVIPPPTLPSTEDIGFTAPDRAANADTVGNWNSLVDETDTSGSIPQAA
jgi:hypothetical protein